MTDYLNRSPMRFGMQIDLQFDGTPLKACEIFPAFYEVTGDPIPPLYYAEMILECKLMELRGRELWAEPSWDDEMHLTCKDVGEKIAYWYQKLWNEM